MDRPLRDIESASSARLSPLAFVPTLLGAGATPVVLDVWLIRVPNDEFVGFFYAVDAAAFVPFVASALIAAAGAALAPSLRSALWWQLAIAAAAFVVAAVTCVTTPALGAWGVGTSFGVIAGNAAVVALASLVAARIRGRSGLAAS
ncbi:MAG: hypothetical protein J7513_10845 [Solirubrobacteraceae bacterium]|nr:hypothetical protein [Solirubrobacteraceae bacterium]